jgi:methenyltetrahydrofolate cyclohydrolase
MPGPVAVRVDPDRLPELSIRELLDLVASPERVPAGGSGAALVVAIAAGLVGKAARLSRSEWLEAGGAVAQADTLRARAVSLAQSDAVAYEDALATLTNVEQIEPDRRDAAIQDALVRSAEIPLLISQTACDVSQLAADVAEAGNPEISADAAVAALLAGAAARAAGHLVEVNLATVPEDERAARGEVFASKAASAARRALTGATQ